MLSRVRFRRAGASGRRAALQPAVVSIPAARRGRIAMTVGQVVLTVDRLEGIRACQEQREARLEGS